MLFHLLSVAALGLSSAAFTRYIIDVRMML